MMELAASSEASQERVPNMPFETGLCRRGSLADSRAQWRRWEKQEKRRHHP